MKWVERLQQVNKRLKEKLFRQDQQAMFLERAVAIKRASEKFADQPDALRYALTFAEILSSISVIIDEDDIIVGRIRETVPTKEEREELVGDFWMGTVLGTLSAEEHFSREFESMPGQRFDLQLDSPFMKYWKPPWFMSVGHITVSWERLLTMGMQGIRELAQERLKALQPIDSAEVKKSEFLQAVIICCDAVTNYIYRYAEEAGRLAKETKDNSRRNELSEIKEICQKVPAYPPENFREALQSIWFLELILHTVGGSIDYSLGRMDQYLYPIYRRDIERGMITRDEAKEILKHLFIHENELSGIGDQWASRRKTLWTDSVIYVFTGGQTAEGRDAVNDLSFLILDALDELRLKSPPFMVRYHHGINREFWLKTCDALRRGLVIGIYNDEAVVPAFIGAGFTKEVARTYAHVGCLNAAIPGKEPQHREYQFNLLKYLELALNNGLDPVTNTQMGPQTGDTSSFNTFEELMTAYCEQLRHGIKDGIENKAQFWAVASSPFTFESVLLDGCVENAADCNEGGTGYIHVDYFGGGIATIADSLAAIRKLVFEDKEMSLAQLRDMLNKNFEGHEVLRQRLLNKFPKFGNDDDYVDSIAREVGFAFCHEVLKYKNTSIGISVPGLYTWHRNKSLGWETGATPDGRKARDPLSENQSASSGMDRKGPTALLNSVVKLPLNLTAGGGLTINLHPTMVAGEEGTKTLSDFFETFFHKGGLMIQVNIIDKKTLLNAQKHPEKHRNLVVRVTGYSAYFVALDPATQDNIIARTTMQR